MDRVTAQSRAGVETSSLSLYGKESSGKQEPQSKQRRVQGHHARI